MSKNMYGTVPLRKEEKSNVFSHSASVNHKLITSNPYLQVATAQNTRKAYQSDVHHYEKSGGGLPAKPEDILTYLERFAAQLNPRTLSRRLTALKHWHIYQGFDDPTLHPVIRKTLKGITNTHGKPKEKAAPLAPDQLSQIIAYLQQEDTLMAWRDNALLQLGYFGAFRRSELVSLQYDHIERFKEGITVLVPRSKTDQSGDGQHCAIPYGNSRLCPIRALDVWLGGSKITQGAIFRQIDRWGTLGDGGLTPLALTQIIKRRAKACQIPNAMAFSSHSLRRGLATSASYKGASLKAIMRQGRWQHVGTVLGYIEDGQQFEDNAAAVVLHDEDP